VRKTRGEFASESYTSCHVRSDIYILVYIYIYIFASVIYKHIYIYKHMDIRITFPQSFVLCGPISAVIAILYSDFYPIYYSSSVPTRSPKLPTDVDSYSAKVFRNPRGIRVRRFYLPDDRGRRDPTIPESGRSIIISL